jgi:hypothetical protein
VQRCWGRRRQRFIWVNAIDYAFGSNGRQRLKLHVVVCEESWEWIDQQAATVTKTGRHAWLSSQPLSQDNVHERCNLGARQRWGIEAGFLVEKHQGYHYEHAFALDWNAMQGYHLLMRLAHVFNTLARSSPDSYATSISNSACAVPSPSSEAPAPPPGSTQRAFACYSPSHSCFNLSELTQAYPKHPLKRGVRSVRKGSPGDRSEVQKTFRHPPD